MLTPGYHRRQRINSSVIRHLANATATFDIEGRDVVLPAVYYGAHQHVEVGSYGAASSQPAIKVAVDLLDVADPAAERLRVIVRRDDGPNGVEEGRFYVTESHPDGTGLATLLLERDDAMLMP